MSKNKPPFNIHPSTLLSQACDTLKLGGVLAYPTESVFGLGCMAFNETALARLRAIKHRSQQKGFIVLCASVEQLLEYFPALNIDESQQKKIIKQQTHPTTWLIPSQHNENELLQGDNQSIAIRITQHPIAKALCENLGPIVSTSANKEGELPAITLATIRETFGEKIDYYLDGALGGEKTPSQIINLDNDEIIRSA